MIRRPGIANFVGDAEHRAERPLQKEGWAMSDHLLRPHPEHEHPAPGHLQRSVGFYGLMFVSLGSIIGSGWLLGALNAAETAGPASIISWAIAAAMLSVLALVYAELGAAYPV